MLDETGARLVIARLKHLTGFAITDEVIDRAVDLARRELEAEDIARQDELGVLRVAFEDPEEEA